LTELVRYRAESFPSFTHGPMERVPGLQDYLALPPGFNPRTSQLAQEIRQEPRNSGANNAVLVEAVLQHLRSGGYNYTLEPGVFGIHTADEFWFDRKEGFCEHIASSFVLLLRAMGVPARVVTGYQGGDVNPLDGYWTVRQSDAHAWSEVWLPGEGWRQVDPSRWIASGGPGLDADQPRSGAMGWLQQEWLQQQWWGLDIGWTRLWLGYDRQSQQALLQRLLGDQLQWLGALVLLALGLCLAAGLAALSWLQRRSEGDAPRRALDATLRQLARAGMGPEPGETLPAFAGRVERRWPQLAPELERFVALYQQLRYGAPPGPSQASRQLRRGRRQLQRRLQRLPR
jgi:hypothetical protein